MSSKVITKQPRSGKNEEEIELGTRMDGEGEDDEPVYPTPPPELKPLDNVDYLHMQRLVGRDIKAGCGSANTYHIKTREGQQLFSVVEESNCCCRWTCGPFRASRLTMYNAQDEEVIRFDRSACRCDWFCCVDCGMCVHKMVIRKADNLQILGIVQQKFHIFHCKLDLLKMDVENKKQLQLKIKGPCCPCRCCTEMQFDILTKEATEDIGYITKTYMETDEGVNTDHDNVEIFLPLELDNTDKVLLLASAFLLSYLYMEMS